MAGVGEGEEAGAQVEDADPRGDEHLRGVVAAELGVGAGERRGGVARGVVLELVADERLGVHHVERAGDPLARDVRAEERAVRLAEREEVVEVAAHLARGPHRGGEAEGRLVREVGRERRRLDRAPQLQLGGLLGGLVRVEGADARGVAPDAPEQRHEEPEDGRQERAHHGREERADPVVFGRRQGGDDAVAAEDDGAAVVDRAEECGAEGRLRVLDDAGRGRVVARLREEARLVAVAGGVGDEVPVPEVRTEEEALLAEEPSVEDEAHDRREHRRDARLADRDLHEAVAAGEGDADVLAAHGRVVRAEAEGVREGGADAVGEDQERGRLLAFGHREADLRAVARGDDDALAGDDVHLVDVALLGDELHPLLRIGPGRAELLDDRAADVHEHRVDRAVQGGVQVQHRVVEHRLGLARGAARGGDPREGDGRAPDRDGGEEDGAAFHGSGAGAGGAKFLRKVRMLQPWAWR